MKEPWTLPGVPWKTESAFYGWIRGILRKGWSRHPVKLEYIKQNRKRIPNPNVNGRVSEVWGMTCQQCGNDFVQSQIEIDHLNPASSLRCKEDIQGFVERLLFITFDDIEAVCLECHAIRTFSQKQGISFEEASMEKIALDLIKKKMDKDWLDAHGITPQSSAEKRRIQIVELLKEEKKDEQEE